MYIAYLQGATTFKASDDVRLLVEPDTNSIWEFLVNIWDWIVAHVFEPAWEWIQNAYIAFKNFIVSVPDWILVHVLLPINSLLLLHPYLTLAISTLICLGPWILIVPLVLLHGFFFIVLGILGFGVAGIVGGSPAAFWQSCCYGGHTPAFSVFACLQAMGMSYDAFSVGTLVLLLIRCLAGAIGVYVLISTFIL